MADSTIHTLNASVMQIVQIHHYASGVNSSEIDKLYQDDAVWIVTSSFIIFTMHSGFGLLESGSVSAKDEVNIMVKNVVDVVFGGLAYWSLGYGLSYGDYEPLRNSFIGFGRFFYDPTRDVTSVNEEGWSYAAFLFQLSLATTASTIVSGELRSLSSIQSLFSSAF
ncbi:Ammonium transporter [Trichostrongylus colubriformis]|uniref:Ammonium transporter n=1 Tax=Trichostrongylus colubriformis TaxID=6319 RepID=A0AAN8FS96_TRICO